MPDPADNRARDVLATITAPLMRRESTIGDAAAAVAALETFLERHSPFRRDDSVTAGESYTADGWAVSPTQAAMCARDYRRTHAFVDGLRRAIDEAARDGSTRPVRVLYAGCGPWALLALPVMASLPADRVRFTLVDIHQDSVDSVSALITSVGLQAWVDEIIRADAAQWTIPDRCRPDVLVTETMNVCLEKEPQVAITRHLLSQAPEARLVPQSVRIDAVLVDPRRERSVVTNDGEGPSPTPDRHDMGTVFELTRATVASWANSRDADLPGGRIRMPAVVPPTHEPRLFTRIETYDGVTINTYDSWLTEPRRFPGGTPAPGATVCFRYAFTPVPGLTTTEWPDRLRLPVQFDPTLLREALDTLEQVGWTDHFVTDNYTGRWTVIPLRSAAGTEHSHPILQIVSHPDATEFVDTPALALAPYFRHVIDHLGFPVDVVRLMQLDPGSCIKTHCDPDLAAEDGCVRLHIPILTNPAVEFLLNDTAVRMAAGECWYLRLSDPHAVRNDGDQPRVHLVIDARISPALEAVLADALQTRAVHAS